VTQAQSIVVVAHWRTTEGALDTIEGLLAELRPRSLAEPGCLGYEILQGRDDPTSIVLIERYRDEVSLEAHAGSLHYQDLVVAKIRPLLTDRTVEIFHPHG
jgi:quinol monooxygenase YgiN